MGAEFILCDVFCEAPGEGNQLCVFPRPEGLDEAFLQRAAHEINFSETTFLLPPESSDDDLRIRIFTPARELPFAGHPIVGSAVVAAAIGLASGRDNVVRFTTGVGRIPVEVELFSERHGRAEMRQPTPRTVRETVDGAEITEIARAVGLAERHVAVDRSPIALLDNGLPLLIVPLDSLESVRSIRPNPAALEDVCARAGALTLCLFTTETVDPEAHVHCRIFAPGAGVGEDPATGSANGPLGAYLVRHGLASGEVVVSEQGFEMGRPSRISIWVGRAADGTFDDVRVAGDVHIVGEGRFFPW